MGVYSLEAAELLAAKNKPAVNESFAPYENPILEYGIKSIRADFALFEAQLELDFKEYYDTLNEADNNNTNNQSGNTSDPEFDANKREADRQQAEHEKDIEAQKNANEKASKDSKLRQAAGKMKIDSGTIKKFGEFIKRIWQNLITSLKSLFNRLVAGFNKFYDANGEKFQATVAKLTPENVSKYSGGNISIINPDTVHSKYKDIIDEYKSAFGDLKNKSLEDVNDAINDIKNKMRDASVEVHSEKRGAEDSNVDIQGSLVPVKGAVSIIIANKDKIKGFKELAKKEYEDLIQFGQDREREANNDYSAALRDGGQEKANQDTSLQLNKEKAQKVSQLGANIGAEYGKALSSATGSLIKAASSIVANIEGRSLKQKASAAGATIKGAIKNRKNNNSNNESEDENEGGEQPEATHASALIDSDDDLLTESEAANILQFMVEDVCDINFDECFNF